MFYKFPVIEHINQVKAAIEGKPEFIVAEREHFDIVNYVVSMPDTFPPILQQSGKLTKNLYGTWYPVADAERLAILRECRGIMFDKKGRILSRPFHKFFNLNEREETQLGNIDTEASFVWQTKMDGSMIRPVYIEAFDSFRWCTKMGLSDVALQAEAYVADKQHYVEFARMAHEGGYTPIFEFCSRGNRVVVDYKEPSLTLLSVRDNVTGQYLLPDFLYDFAKINGIPFVRTGDRETIKSLVEYAQSQEGIEGYIVVFHNGHKLKIKTPWYVAIHKAKENLLWEKNVIQVLLEEGADDLKPHLQEDDLKRLNDFEFAFWTGIKDVADWFTLFYNGDYYKDVHHDRKAYAERVNNSGCSGHGRTIYFKLFGSEGDEAHSKAYDAIKLLISKNLGSQTKVDSVRALWGGAKWDYNSGE